MRPENLKLPDFQQPIPAFFEAVQLVPVAFLLLEHGPG